MTIKFAAHRTAVLMACASLLQSPNSVATAAPENRTADVIVEGGGGGGVAAAGRGGRVGKPVILTGPGGNIGGGTWGGLAHQHRPQGGHRGDLAKILPPARRALCRRKMG